jgi:hypothetical protein
MDDERQTTKHAGGANRKPAASLVEIGGAFHGGG